MMEVDKMDSILFLSHLNSAKLAEIVSCANKFKENKAKLFEILSACKDFVQKFIKIAPDHLKEFVRSEEFQEAEHDMNKYFQCFQRICSAKDEESIQKQCSYNTELIESVKSALGYSSSNDALYARPCLAVFGQTKAGKSSLVNSLLEEKIVIQKDTRCTARVTYLSYCMNNFVAHTLGNTLQELRLNDKVTEKEVDLSRDDRSDTLKVQVEIRIGSTNKILKSGIDVIDSPGLNENSALNEICANVAKTFLPIIIYVIDGRKGVTEEDIDDIRHMQNENPELKMIFFVTKLDRSANDRKRKPDADEVDIAVKRLQNAFEKLKKWKCLPEDVKMESCEDFHGASLWTVQEWQSRADEPRKSEVKLSEKLEQAEEFNLRQFLRFQESILQFVKDHLENKMIRAAEKLQVSIETLIEKLSTVAGEYSEDRDLKLESIRKFAHIEKKLYDSELGDMDKSLKEKIGIMIDRNQADFLNALKTAKYSHVIEKGFNSQHQRPEVLKQCQDEIRKLLEIELNRHVKLFVIDFMNEGQISFKNELRKIVAELAEGPMGLTSFEIMLQNRLLHEYEFNVQYSGNDVHKSAVNTFFKNILRPVKAIMAQFKQHLPEDKQPNSSSWKEAQGRLLLERLNKEEFITGVYSVIIEGFKEKHKRFENELSEQRRVLDGKMDVVEETKKKLKNLVEDLALEFMYCFEIRTDYVIEFDLNDAKQIGEGGQAFVLQNRDLIAKVMKIDNKSGEKMCAMEVYFASRLNHPRVLQLQGIHLKRINNFKKECTLYYPYLSGRNLKEFIETRKPPLDKRVQYAIEIAEGIMVLHRQKITHRDIKLENILMRPKTDDFQAVVADYGFVKHSAWMNVSKWGTPLHIAPEMLRREKYDQRIDIFSYGILLWFLISYLTGDNYEYYPNMVRECKQDVTTLEKLILEGERPERRNGISDKIWELMESCWDDDPLNRPELNDIIEKLRYIKQNNLY